MERTHIAGEDCLHAHRSVAARSRALYVVVAVTPSGCAATKNWGDNAMIAMHERAFEGVETQREKSTFAYY